MIKKLLLCLLVSCACTVHARSWIDLSKRTNLNDKKDDTAAFQKAINDAGNGGVVYIPTGAVYINKTISIKDKSMSIIGSKLGESIIIKRFAPHSGNRNPGLSFIADSQACHWMMKNIIYKASGEKNGLGIQVKDNNGWKRKSSFEVRDGLISSGSGDNWFEFLVDIDGMNYVRLKTNMSGHLKGKASKEDSIDNITLPSSFNTKSLVRLVGKKSGTVIVSGKGRYRQADSLFKISADYDTLIFNGGRVVCNKGILFDGSVGRRFILRAGNEQSDFPTNVKATELISVGKVRYAKTKQATNKYAYSFTGVNNPIIHIFASKLAEGVKFTNSSKLGFFANTVGNVEVDSKSSNILASANFALKPNKTHDYHEAIARQGRDTVMPSSAKISVMEVIK